MSLSTTPIPTVPAPATPAATLPATTLPAAVSAWASEPDRVRGGAGVSRLLPRRADPLLIGLLGFTLSAAFSWVPSLWYDEAATVIGSTRSWPQLVEMLGSVDAVHGLFYALMHLWFDLVGYSPFTLRLPSALATGVAAALVVLLVRRFTPRGTALLAGLLFCLLPRVTWMGGEGRSFALSTLLALLLTLVFLTASERSASQTPGVAGGLGASGRRADGRWWLLYGVLAILSTTLFLYVCLIVVAHGVSAVWAALAGGSRARGGWAAVRGWMAASVVAGLVLLPFVAVVVGQAGQVSWIAEISPSSVDDIVVVQWFLYNPRFAVLGWALILGGLGVLGRRAWLGRVTADTAAPAPGTPGVPSLLALLVPWLLLPTLTLIALSVLTTPVFSPRYLAFAAPAAAILMAVAVSALPRRWLRVTAILACVAVAAPGYVAQRLPEAKQESSWNEVADLIAAERAAERLSSPDATGEAVIYGPVRQHPSATTRVIAYAYPDAFAGLVDVKLRTPAAETGQLWETRYPLAEVTDRLIGLDTVWLVTSNKQDWRPSVTARLAGLGYALDREWNLTGVNVLRYER